MVGLVIGASLLAGACYTGTGVEHYAAVLDEFAYPVGWELVKTEPRGPGEESDCDPVITNGCPAVARWYLVDGDAAAALRAAQRVVEGANFEVDRVIHPDCDGTSSAPACVLFSKRDADRVRVAVFRSAQGAGLDNMPVGRSAVMITAER
jgi:hypothetical protein